MTLRSGWIKGKMCAVFPTRRATDVHHIRGRIGQLLFDQKYWLPVSREGHIWIDNNIEEARAKGWIAAKGDWNKQETRNNDHELHDNTSNEPGSL